MGYSDSALTDLDSLYQGAYDFPESGGSDRRTYMLATTQRSGSTLLALSLWRSGCLGAPLEYLKTENVRIFARRCGAKNAADYWKELLSRRTSPNGVFGCKIFYSQLVALERSRSALSGAVRADSYIFLTREDKRAQALSLHKALETNAWIAGQKATQRATLDKHRIEKCHDFILRQEDDWRRFFSGLKVSPLVLTYESVVTAPDLAVSSVATAVGVRLGDSILPYVPTLQKQSTWSI